MYSKFYLNITWPQLTLLAGDGSGIFATVSLDNVVCLVYYMLVYISFACSFQMELALECLG